MKKYILLLLTPFIVSACSNDNLEQQEQEVENNDSNGVSAEENQSEETESNNTANSVNNESSNEETEENSNNSDENIERMIQQFVKDMYVESSLNDFRHSDEIISEEFKERIETQLAEIDSEQELPDMENRTDKVDIYKNTSNRNDEYMYIVELEVINHDMEDIHRSKRIGVISLIEESETLKIDNVEEISNIEINE